MVKKASENKLYGVKVSTTLSDGIDKYVKEMQEDYPGYNPSVLFRVAITKFLKTRGYLK